MEGKGGLWARRLRRRLPLLAWAARYSRLDAVADLVAGATLGLTMVPQAIAYAALAGLPVHYGLYSSFVGSFVYVVLGTVKEVSIGPTSLMALLTLQATRHLPVEYVVLLTFVSGAVVLLMGLLRLGFLVELISPAVTSGFTSGTAIIIVVAQLKGLLGLSFTAETVPENLSLIAENIHRVHWPDFALAFVCCTVLLLLRKLKDVPVSEARPALRKALWLLSIGRNAIVVCGAAVFAFCICDPDHPHFKLSGRVQAGLPRPRWPPFSVRQGDELVGLGGMLRELGAAVLLLPVVMVLANIAIAKAFSTGRQLDATQEMLTLGLCNMAGALVQAMPACGAFTRSAVAHSSGVRSPAASLYSGLIVLFALGFMTQYFYFIPKACLSSVLICAVIFMIDVSIFGRLWRRSKPDLAVVCITLLVSLAISVELALLAGALSNMAVLLWTLGRPHVEITVVEGGRGVVALSARVSPALVYAGCGRVSSRLQRASAARPTLPLLLDLHALHVLDLSALECLEQLAAKFKSMGQTFILYNASTEMLAQLEHEGWVDTRNLRARTAAAALALAAPSAEAAPVAEAASAETGAEAETLLAGTELQHITEKVTL